jgi:hypothetical protein
MGSSWERSPDAKFPTIFRNTPILPSPKCEKLSEFTPSDVLYRASQVPYKGVRIQCEAFRIAVRREDVQTLEHFRSVQSPSHLENWLAANEVRIITHVTHHQNQNRTGQRNITDFLTPTAQTAPTPLQPPSVTSISASIDNAPLTHERGRFADDGLRARR